RTADERGFNASAAPVCSSQRAFRIAARQVGRSGADDYRRANIGPVPQEQTVLEIQAQAAVRARIAKVAGPVVVVKARAIAREILCVQHVLEVVAAGPVRVDSECAAVHRLILDSALNGKEAG